MLLANPDATDSLGAAMATTRPPRAVVYLHGDLGAGKSTLARAMLRSLGVRGAIRSPTYTLIERYMLSAESGDEAVHLDLYRIAAAAELEFLGLDDLSAHATLWLVEWPERGTGALPPADLLVHLAPAGDCREAVLEPESPVGNGWLERLALDTRIAGRSSTFGQIPGAPF